MIASHSKIFAALLIGTFALVGAGCTKDKMMGDGAVRKDSGSMTKMDSDNKTPQDQGMMKQ